MMIRDLRRFGLSACLALALSSGPVASATFLASFAGNTGAAPTWLHLIADDGLKSGGVVSLGGNNAAGCTEAALNEEASALIAGFGTQPATASGAWKYAYDVTKALIELTKVQAARCPDIDLTYAMQYHTTNLEGLERTGRAAGWL